MTLAERIAVYLPIAASAFAAVGLPPELGAAIAHQESNWEPDSQTIVGGDARRGGSYGLCQVSLKTALWLDPAATVTKLLDPDYNCQMAAQLCEFNRTLSPSLPDIISRYNSGRPLAKAPKSTRMGYVPSVLRLMFDYTAPCLNIMSKRGGA